MYCHIRVCHVSINITYLLTDDALMTAGGSSFQTQGAATPKARSPIVDRMNVQTNGQILISLQKIVQQYDICFLGLTIAVAGGIVLGIFAGLTMLITVFFHRHQ